MRCGLLCLRLDALLEVVKTSRQYGDKAMWWTRVTNQHQFFLRMLTISPFSFRAFGHREQPLWFTLQKKHP